MGISKYELLEIQNCETKIYYRVVKTNSIPALFYYI